MGGLARRDFLAGAGGAAVALAQSAAGAQTAPYRGHGLAIYGQPAYPADYAHFDSVDPGAPKGGTAFLGANGTFDDLNGFIVKGSPAEYLGLLHLTLMAPSDREPMTKYAQLARSVELPADRSWVAFEIDERAVFHDGTPVTAADAAFSFELLRDKGRPFYRTYYRDVTKVETEGPRRIIFRLGGDGNRELPLIMGELPVLSRKYWQSRDFEKQTLDPPLGCGPYRLGKIEPGRSLVYERIQNHWAENLPPLRGTNNFDRLQIDYFRDDTVIREAFKAGEFDYRYENTASAWARSYNVSAVADGSIVKRTVKRRIVEGMQGFALNMRRGIFADWRVRRALAFAFDFEWTNGNILHGQYVRAVSYFNNSDLASADLPTGDERALLETFKDRLPGRVFTEAFSAPGHPGDGDIRAGLRAAFRLFAEAGWEVRDLKMAEKATGRPLRFEILLDDPTWERHTLPYVRNLRRLGIEARVRVVDAAQYINRIKAYDFDAIVATFGQSEQPGNELRDMFGSKAADTEDTQNYCGLKDPVVDELLDRIVRAESREELVVRVRALDRVLLHHHMVVPHWYIDYDRILYWNKFGLPKGNERVGIPFMSWWVDRDRAKAMAGRLRSETGVR